MKRTERKTTVNRGMSLHLGLNYIDPEHYDGWDGELAGCEADAKDMMSLAKSRGFAARMLLRKQVTAREVKEAIANAAASLKKGDTFLLTYSGHGGQVPDRNGDEGKFGDAADSMDETWCLYDRELIDDELAALYAKFRPGVRILVLSDSCHSGSVVRGDRERSPVGRVRMMPRARAASVYEKHRGLYDAIQAGVPGIEQLNIKATVLLISACQDRQFASDGDQNGLFTGSLLKVWAKGSFDGGYRHFHHRISAEINDPKQTPNFFRIGAADLAFENEQPFTVNPGDQKVKPAAKPAAKTAPKRSTRKPAARPPSVMDKVLEILTHYGYAKPQPDSLLTKWFERVAREDEAAAVPGPGRLAFMAAAFNEKFGVGMTKSKMLGGHFPTPQAIADLA